MKHFMLYMLLAIPFLASSQTYLSIEGGKDFFMIQSGQYPLSSLDAKNAKVNQPWFIGLGVKQYFKTKYAIQLNTNYRRRQFLNFEPFAYLYEIHDIEKIWYDNIRIGLHFSTNVSKNWRFGLGCGHNFSPRAKVIGGIWNLNSSWKYNNEFKAVDVDVSFAFFYRNFSLELGGYYNKSIAQIKRAELLNSSVGVTCTLKYQKKIFENSK